MKKQPEIAYKKLEETTELWFSLPEVDLKTFDSYDSIDNVFRDICLEHGGGYHGLKRLEIENSSKLVECKKFLKKNPGTLYVVSIPSKNVSSMLKYLGKYILKIKATK